MKIRIPRSPLRAGALPLLFGLILAALAGVSGCAVVKQKDREFLADPIMQRVPDPLGTKMESHNLPRREGSAGGSAGSGGGCGC
jgi:hypothetical protein